MTFGVSQWLWALLMIPFLAALFVRAERRARLRLRDFVSERLLPNLARTVDHRRRNVRFAYRGDRDVLHGVDLDVAEELGGYEIDVHLCSNRTCEIGLQEVTGAPYASFVLALERATRP